MWLGLETRCFHFSDSTLALRSSVRIQSEFGKGRWWWGQVCFCCPLRTPEMTVAVVLPNAVIPVAGGLPLLAGHLFRSWLANFPLKTVCDLSQIWGRFVNSGLFSLCVPSCWLIVEEIKRPSPGFWIWSWMKLACGKAKYSPLRYVFLTWNQLALHKYGGFLSQQQWEANRAVRQVRRGQGLSCSCALQMILLSS